MRLYYGRISICFFFIFQYFFLISLKGNSYNPKIPIFENFVGLQENSLQAAGNIFIATFTAFHTHFDNGIEFTFM